MRCRAPTGPARRRAGTAAPGCDPSAAPRSNVSVHGARLDGRRAAGVAGRRHRRAAPRRARRAGTSSAPSASSTPPISTATSAVAAVLGERLDGDRHVTDLDRLADDGRRRRVVLAGDAQQLDHAGDEDHEPAPDGQQEQGPGASRPQATDAAQPKAHSSKALVVRLVGGGVPVAAVEALRVRRARPAARTPPPHRRRRGPGSTAPPRRRRRRTRRRAASSSRRSSPARPARTPGSAGRTAPRRRPSRRRPRPRRSTPRRRRRRSPRSRHRPSESSAGTDSSLGERLALDRVVASAPCRRSGRASSSAPSSSPGRSKSSSVGMSMSPTSMSSSIEPATSVICSWSCSISSRDSARIDGQDLLGPGGHRAEVPAPVDLLDDEAGVDVVVERRLERRPARSSTGWGSSSTSSSCGMLSAISQLFTSSSPAARRDDPAAVAQLDAHRLALGAGLERDGGDGDRAGVAAAGDLVVPVGDRHRDVDVVERGLGLVEEQRGVALQRLELVRVERGDDGARGRGPRRRRGTRPSPPPGCRRRSGRCPRRGCPRRSPPGPPRRRCRRG